MIMKKFKDLNNKPHEIQEGFEHLLPNGCTEIDQTEFDTLTAPAPLTAQEISDNNDAQVETELGGDNIRILVETFLEIVQNGSIDTAIPNDVIALAKSKRRNEL